MLTKWSAIDRIVTAKHLRRFSSIYLSRVAKKKSGASSTGEKLRDEQLKQFILSEFCERDLEILELKILNAAKHGVHEIEVMSFPATYCIDGGRAINNSEKDWPTTLQGKASSFYVIWKEHGRPSGYRLTAKVTDFPDGYIGNISLFINWS